MRRIFLILNVLVVTAIEPACDLESLPKKNFGYFEKCEPEDHTLKQTCLLVCEEGFQLSKPKYNRIKCNYNAKKNKSVWKSFKTTCVEKDVELADLVSTLVKTVATLVKTLEEDRETEEIRQEGFETKLLKIISEQQKASEQIAGCPCFTYDKCPEEPTSTTVSTTTTTKPTTTTTSTMTTTSVEFDFEDINYDVPTSTLRSLGFREYVSAVAYSDSIQNGMKPPPGAVEVFMGCGEINSNILKMGAVATPAELFDQIGYPENIETDAKAVRNFYAYYSSTTYEPIGFSKTSTIKLHEADLYDLSDESKLSAHTTFSAGYNLWRCGSHLDRPADFYTSFKIVFYYR